ncbi:MAG: hypothetical protein PHI12_06400 [Dehalococcoidales bacterium]|nr:hypothetical protein [Dehalococcoidales bacterium]
MNEYQRRQQQQVELTKLTDFTKLFTLNPFQAIWYLLPQFPWEGPPVPRFLPGWPWNW